MVDADRWINPLKEKWQPYFIGQSEVTHVETATSWFGGFKVIECSLKTFPNLQTMRLNHIVKQYSGIVRCVNLDNYIDTQNQSSGVDCSLVVFFFPLQGGIICDVTC